MQFENQYFLVSSKVKYLCTLNSKTLLTNFEIYASLFKKNTLSDFLHGNSFL
jgi:hypothetical protein